MLYVTKSTVCLGWKVRSLLGEPISLPEAWCSSLSFSSRFNWSELIPMRLWGRTLGLQTENSQFLLEGMPFRIFGGSMHYFRVPREYWEDRMLKMKACGLNTLTTYVPWNLHEQTRGKFDFTQDLDLEAFLSLAAKNGLWVILRPGPYICSEWDLGGLPSWLLQDPEMQLRTTYKGFTEAVDAYFDHLMPIVVPLQYKKGGPIIAVQVENEYGSYAKDPNYMAYVKRVMLARLLISVFLSSIALATVNFQKLEPGVLKYLDTVQRDQPKMVMEYWTGWFDNWGGPHYVFDADEMVNTVASILKLGASINLYMFHGGTNFGFMNGALETDEYKSDVTSYGDCSIFLSFCITGQPLPLPPMIESKASYGAILLHQYISLWDVLPSLIQPVKSEFPVNMENLHLNDSSGQSYGYVLYETVIFGGGHLHSRDHVLWLFSYSLQQVAGWSAVPDYFVGPAFFRGRLWIEHQPQDTFLKLQGWEKGVVFVNGHNLGRYWKIGPQETLYLPGPWLQKGNNEIVIFEERTAGRIIQSVDIPYLGRTQYVD
uniref:Beta-galactosidase n=1 Tax=Anas zonorhyncha TaxID=75864 RepID=A0A8B9U169_9AVES